MGAAGCRLQVVRGSRSWLGAVCADCASKRKSKYMCIAGWLNECSLLLPACLPAPLCPPGSLQVLDHGYPQVTDPAVMKSFIFQKVSSLSTVMQRRFWG